MCNTDSDKNSKIAVIDNMKGQFIGSSACKKCHADIYKSQLLTAHFNTSNPATLSTVMGSFEKGKNIFNLNSQLKVEMQEINGRLFQSGFVDGEKVISEPFSIVIGSGSKGQTYLYWYKNYLFQLPVSYYTPLNQWCNSPGYPSDKLLFNRIIPGRCLECHSTHFKTISMSGKAIEYDTAQIIYGVGCERCHGPGAEHVAYQLENPGVKEAKYIINPFLLTRQQKLDNCALCHSGIRQNSKSTFTYITGDKLDDYSTPDYKKDSAGLLDVHANQYGLLTASKCFKMSKMDCSSCHNVHEKQTNEIQMFSQKCMTCHAKVKHTFSTEPSTSELVLQNNCIDCHMPLMPSKKIFLNASDTSKSTADLIRTHLIAIYYQDSKVFLKKIRRVIK